MKIISEAPSFRLVLWKRSPKNWGMVAESRCWDMMRVRRPRITQAIREPMMAFPMPAQVADIP